MKKCILAISVLLFILMTGFTNSYAQWWTSSGWWSSSSTSSSSSSTSSSSSSSSSSTSSSSSSGSIEAMIEAGGTIPAGTYTMTRKISLSKTSGITITANNVILDAKNLGSSADAVTVSGSNYKIIGLTVKNAGHNGICVKGNSNTFTNVITHSCGNTGFNIKGSAKNNTVTGCKSYNNYDTSTYGENADGFGVKDCTGSGNKFVNCEAWNNSDDGWDFWGTTGAVTLTGCYAHDNGRGSAGDGNGFKLGESGVCGKHYLKDCTAKNNRACGFTKNGNTCTITYVNCVSSSNGKSDNR